MNEGALGLSKLVAHVEEYRSTPTIWGSTKFYITDPNPVKDSAGKSIRCILLKLNLRISGLKITKLSLLCVTL